ncbi:hypothetical protein ADUPG1_003355 [Aduncisulcus paluster]|uniref:Uncharacterized protein n=1 Tax=Aduncisulcus paluster TaxID=2918883 RepID=A0ABQ5KY99_9EUKA|nr:hypothetical protein ADUPG1_003355 [Aduncisulcus paluster]
MLVDDVVADSGMHSYRNAQFVCFGEKAKLSVREFVFTDVFTNSFTESKPLRVTFGNYLIEQSGLLPEAELTVGNVGSNAFRSLPKEGEFKIMDGAGPVDRNAADQPFAH